MRLTLSCRVSQVAWKKICLKFEILAWSPPARWVGSWQGGCVCETYDAIAQANGPERHTLKMGWSALFQQVLVNNVINCAILYFNIAWHSFANISDCEVHWKITVEANLQASWKDNKVSWDSRWLVCLVRGPIIVSNYCNGWNNCTNCCEYPQRPFCNALITRTAQVCRLLCELTQI